MFSISIEELFMRIGELYIRNQGLEAEVKRLKEELQKPKKED